MFSFTFNGFCINKRLHSRFCPKWWTWLKAQKEIKQSNYVSGSICMYLKSIYTNNIYINQLSTTYITIRIYIYIHFKYTVKCNVFQHTISRHVGANVLVAQTINPPVSDNQKQRNSHLEEYWFCLVAAWGWFEQFRWAAKKTLRYFPLNPGWLIGILIMVHYNPYIPG